MAALIVGLESSKDLVSDVVKPMLLALKQIDSYGYSL